MKSAEQNAVNIGAVVLMRPASSSPAVSQATSAPADLDHSQEHLPRTLAVPHICMAVAST